MTAKNKAAELRKKREALRYKSKAGPSHLGMTAKNKDAELRKGGEALRYKGNGR